MISDQQLLDEALRVLNEEISSLESVKNRLGESFPLAVRAISRANKLLVSGVGKSGMIARKIAATFSSIGISASFLDPVDALHGDIGTVQKGDVCILLSKSGATEEIVRLVPYLKSRSARIISIIGNMKSFLSESSDIVLDATVSREACPYNLAPTSSTLAAMAIGDALAMACISYNNISLDDLSRLHPLGQIGKSFTLSVKDVMHSEKNLPVISINDSFLDAIVEISDKKLGCACVVDAGNKLLGIITDGDIRRFIQNGGTGFANLMAKEIMTKNPVTINPDSGLNDALALMENRESQISVLPVVADDYTCIGVIRIHDIVRSGV